MGKLYNYTSVDRIISKLYRDLGLEEIVEIDAIEWAGEALEAIGAGAIYEEAIVALQVENYSAQLPIGLHSIIQVARDNEPEELEENNICSEIEQVEEMEEILQPDLFFTTGIPYNIQKFLSNPLYKSRFTPVRLSNHAFFNTLVYQEQEENYCYTKDEYTIQNDCIKTSFEEGTILISYKRQKLDLETCYPMIPDSYSYITAITTYIKMKIFNRMWYSGREGDYRNMAIKAEEEWHWYCKQAGNESFILNGIDEHQNYLEQRLNLLPIQNKYYGFFGNLNSRDNEIFKQ